MFLFNFQYYMALHVKLANTHKQGYHIYIVLGGLHIF